MKKSEFTPEQVAAGSCPICFAAIGEPFVLQSGALRSEPHVDRKLSAIDAIEKKSA